jgi:hypothetical protein
VAGGRAGIRNAKWGKDVTEDLICLSHLRWDFVYQRPNHLMARAARSKRVFFIEEARLEPGARPHIQRADREGVSVMTPVLRTGMEAPESDALLADLLDDLIATEQIEAPILWYYTPMALPWTRHVASSVLVYDCMDYLAGFKGAPEGLLSLEDELICRADLVFSGGARLHQRLEARHSDSHCFPSSIDVRHFAAARLPLLEPADQRHIARPRLGYAGVIDERLDLGLIDGVAARRPDWQIVLLGPVAKIAAGDIPARRNIHQLGRKTYGELPSYLAHWSVGWMPFARNDATAFISPTKTPEYLAAGLPVVSTSIRDVIDPYARRGMVRIADTVDETVAVVAETMRADRAALQPEVDHFLAMGSWDRTWEAMAALVERAAERVAPSENIGSASPLDRVPVPIAPSTAEALPTSLVLGAEV